MKLLSIISIISRMRMQSIPGRLSLCDLESRLANYKAIKLIFISFPLLFTSFIRIYWIRKNELIKKRFYLEALQYTITYFEVLKQCSQIVPLVSSTLQCAIGSALNIVSPADIDSLVNTPRPIPSTVRSSSDGGSPTAADSFFRSSISISNVNALLASIPARPSFSIESGL